MIAFSGLKRNFLWFVAEVAYQVKHKWLDIRYNWIRFPTKKKVFQQLIPLFCVCSVLIFFVFEHLPVDINHQSLGWGAVHLNYIRCHTFSSKTYFRSRNLPNLETDNGWKNRMAAARQLDIFLIQSDSYFKMRWLHNLHMNGEFFS